MTIQPQTVIGGVAAVALVTAGGFATWHYLLNKPGGDYYLYALEEGREYVSDSREKVKFMFLGNSDFFSNLDENFDEMKKVNEVFISGDLTREEAKKVRDSGNPKLNEFADYVYRWCAHVAREKVEGARKGDGTWDESKFQDSVLKWKAFKEQCTVEKNKTK
ncbi:hypothetical protein [Candidatus Mycoplasma haematohominis]|uniref:Uncharacterized protein n=1 Tax=Candidatus Mycoplasma haematohominis TaxID=1494318 RepID=A0A478FRA3_9MOLU|nr:hypothetical protein [Candidatus Mycoplasma haemohominis]GCE63697.1 hypothetical protein MHSWG343_06970 [Candidatus Mycoplasma haemohominis]